MTYFTVHGTTLSGNVIEKKLIFVELIIVFFLFFFFYVTKTCKIQSLIYLLRLHLNDNRNKIKLV